MDEEGKERGARSKVKEVKGCEVSEAKREEWRKGRQEGVTPTAEQSFIHLLLHLSSTNTTNTKCVFLFTFTYEASLTDNCFLPFPPPLCSLPSRAG